MMKGSAMSGNEYEDDYDFEDEGSSVLRALRKENRAKEKQIKELQERLSALATQNRDKSVKDVLAAKGLNPKIARFVPEDLASDEEVAAWVEEFSDIFGGSAPAQDESPSGSGESTASSEVAAFQQNGQVQSTGISYSGDPDQLAALIQSARTPEELNKVLFGSESGPNAF